MAANEGSADGRGFIACGIQSVVPGPSWEKRVINQWKELNWEERKKSDGTV